MGVLYKQVLFGVGIILPAVSFASGFGPSQVSGSEVDFDTYVTSTDSYKIRQEMNSVSKYISNISDDAAINTLYLPRVYAAGYGGTDLVWQADLLSPMRLNYDQAFVLYGRGRYSPANQSLWQYDTWAGSLGFLYRQIVSDSSIVGVYLLGDYGQLINGHKSVVIGPGFESLGRTWDFRLNGYIPTGHKFWQNSSCPQEYGGCIEFEEGSNNVYVHEFTLTEEVGIGGDVEIGHKLFKVFGVPVKGYVQGYYYDMKHTSDPTHTSNITGFGLKIIAQPARYLTFSANDVYDKYQHNIFMLGAQLRLNDLFHQSNKPLDEKDLSSRLLDPIDRNYGNIGNGFTVSKNKISNVKNILYNGVFFDDRGSGYVSPHAAIYLKGTYGNPYTEESDIEIRGMQVILDEIHTNFPNQVLMFFAPGSYQAFAGSSPINLYNGMSAYGRDYWYTVSTDGTQRPLFNGSMNLLGNNLLDSVRIQNISSGLFVSGITESNTSGVILNNTEVGTQENSGNYATGIILNNSDLTITNSNIYGYQSGAATADGQINAIGIQMTNGGSLTVDNSEIIGIANEIGLVHDFSGNGYGIQADGNQETITVNTGNITGEGQGGRDYSGNGYGIQVDGNQETITVNAGNITGEGQGGGSYSGNGYGIQADGDQETITVNVGNITGKGQGGGSYSGNGYGIQTAGDQETITVNAGNITGEGKGGTGYSGNGYGILVGENYLNITNENVVLSGNVVNIYSSTLQGKSNNTSSIGTVIYSNNGYGLLVGYGYEEDGSSGPTSGASSSINNNTINIENSTLSGSGYGTYGGLTSDGGGYGLLVGVVNLGSAISSGAHSVYSIYGNSISVLSSTLNGNVCGLLTGYDVFGFTTTDINTIADSNIYNNIITVSSGSVLSGISNSAFTSIAGDGYGLLVGYGFYNINYLPTTSTSVFSGVNSSIYSNNIAVSSSTLQGSGSEGTKGANSLGNGFGLVIGHTYTQITINHNGSNITESAEVNDNTIMVSSDSNLIANSNSSLAASGAGNAYGLLVGADILQLSVTAGSGVNNSISGNTVGFDNSTATVSSLGSSGKAVGIAFDFNFDTGINPPNELDVSSSEITLDAPNKDAYGVYMWTVFGSIGVLNIDYTISNTIRDPSSTGGLKILYPNGSFVSW